MTTPPPSARNTQRTATQPTHELHYEPGAAYGTLAECRTLCRLATDDELVVDGVHVYLLAPIATDAQGRTVWKVRVRVIAQAVTP